MIHNIHWTDRYLSAFFIWATVVRHVSHLETDGLTINYVMEIVLSKFCEGKVGMLWEPKLVRVFSCLPPLLVMTIEASKLRVLVLEAEEKKSEWWTASDRKAYLLHTASSPPILHKKGRICPKAEFFLLMPKIDKLFFFFFHKSSWLIQLDTLIFFKKVFKRYSVSPTYLSILQLFNVKFIFFFFFSIESFLR